jgi:branched-chain amino acid aminotransferase
MGMKYFLSDNVGTHVSLNGKIIEAQAYEEQTDDGWRRASGVAYEVIRTVRGVPMFLEEHCVRLNESLAKLDANAEVNMLSLVQPIAALLRANGVADCNVKIWAAAETPGDINCFMNINSSFYPPPELYSEGVPVGLFAFTRENPNVKQVVDGFKERINALIDSGGVFEILLYDGSRRLTEGSRSNLFFTRGSQLLTAPDRMVLKGTVRRQVFTAARRAGVKIIERPVALEELGLFPGTLDRRREHGSTDSDRLKKEDAKEKAGKSNKTIIFPTPGPWPGTEDSRALREIEVNGAFLTGTSIGVLPISRIGGVKLNSVKDSVILAVMGEYEKIESEYVNARV